MEILKRQFNEVSKTEIKEAALEFLELVESGDVDALKSLVEVKAAQEYLKVLDSELKNQAVQQFESFYDKVETIYYGAKAVVKDLPNKYDYSKDPEIKRLEEEINNLQTQIKERKKLMDSANTIEFYDSDGTKVEPPVLVSKGGYTIAITLKK